MQTKQDKLKVLIVEDDYFSRLLIQEFLKNDCIIMHHVTNGNEAVKYCKENAPDIILMDIHLPELDGISALKKIRKQKPRQKIIAQTAYATNNEKKLIINSGFDAYLRKPFKKNELLRTVAKIGFREYLQGFKEVNGLKDATFIK